MLPKILIPHERGLPIDDVLPPGLSRIEVHKDAPIACTNFFAYEKKAYIYYEKEKAIFPLYPRDVIGVLSCGKSVAVFTQEEIIQMGEFVHGATPNRYKVGKRKITEYYAATDCCLSFVKGKISIISMQEDVLIPVKHTDESLIDAQCLKEGEALLLPKYMSLEGNIYNFSRPTSLLFLITLLDGTRISISAEASLSGEADNDLIYFYRVTISNVTLRAFHIVHPIPLLPCSEEECNSYLKEGTLKFCPPERNSKKSARK